MKDSASWCDYFHEALASFIPQGGMNTIFVT
jgi:hypothetical protein